VPGRLIDRRPEVQADDLVAAMVPPPRFDDVRFSTFLPDPAEPSQREAVAVVEAFAERLAQPPSAKRGLLFGRRRKTTAVDGRPGLYLDGGFGVGKTHLLASLWHAAPGRRRTGPSWR
jgi:cell division protein ZapE